MNLLIKSKIGFKHSWNLISNIFYDDTNLSLVVSGLFGLGVVLIAFLLDVEDTVFYMILSSDSQTVAGLLSILYASIAIIMAISSSTQNLSSENTRWLLGMLKIVQQFRRPIISSMLLVFVLFFTNSTIAIIEAQVWKTPVESTLTFLIISFTVHVIMCTLILSLNMINYIKAEFMYSEESKVRYIEITDETDFVGHFVGLVQDARTTTLGIIDTIEKLVSDSAKYGTVAYLPANHSSLDLLPALVCRLQINQKEASEFYRKSMMINHEFADCMITTNAEMMKLVTDLTELTSDLSIRASELHLDAEDYIACSKMFSVENEVRDNVASGHSDILFETSTIVSDTLTLISSDIMKLTRCLDKMAGDG